MDRRVGRASRPLGLFVLTPSAVSWTVVLSADAVGVESRPVVAICAIPADPIADGVVVDVYVARAGGLEELVFVRLVAADERNCQLFAVPATPTSGRQLRCT